MHLFHIWNIHLYWVKMLRFLLGLLYFFRFHFVFLFAKSYVWWEVCALASHLHAFCFQSGESKKFDDWGELKIFRTGEVTDLGKGVIFTGGGVSTPLHAMRKMYSWRRKIKHMLCKESYQFICLFKREQLKNISFTVINFFICREKERKGKILDNKNFYKIINQSKFLFAALTRLSCLKH